MNRIVVRHEAVEGWSAATNMEYPIDEAVDIASLSVGDEIRGVVFVQGARYWLGEIEVTSRSTSRQGPASSRTSN
ncbi:MAG: copper-binding protein [Bryobacteraceae bacterium]|nr:copper-binding protein [Bryobacteraceae bacterium]